MSNNTGWTWNRRILEGSSELYWRLRARECTIDIFKRPHY